MHYIFFDLTTLKQTPLYGVGPRNAVLTSQVIRYRLPDSDDCLRSWRAPGSGRNLNMREDNDDVIL